MAAFTLQPQAPGAPAANARIGDKIRLQRRSGALWEVGRVLSVGLLDRYNRPLDITVRLASSSVLQVSPSNYPVDSKGPRLVILPAPTELQRTDPRQKLQRFAEKHGLVIVRFVANRDDPTYRLVDPARDYHEVFLQSRRVERATLRFAAGCFYNGRWDTDTCQVTAYRPARLDEEPQVLELPAGFDPS